MRFMGFDVEQSMLPTMREVMDYLEVYGASDRQLAHFREENERVYGNDLIWNYPICDGEHFGFYIVPVREGFLNLPYNALDEEEYELFVLEHAHLMDAEEFVFRIDEWSSYSDGLLSAMRDIAEILGSRIVGEGNSRNADACFSHRNKMLQYLCSL